MPLLLAGAVLTLMEGGGVPPPLLEANLGTLPLTDTIFF